MKKRQTIQKIEFGDFQTPPDLARMVCRVLQRRGDNPIVVIEPTCGIGNFLFAALDQFTSVEKAIALEINQDYIYSLNDALSLKPYSKIVSLRRADFFSTDWLELIHNLQSPILIIGNPPWVTNSELGLLSSNNLPDKSNFQKFSGFDAKTGKSNFDISEWMLIRLIEALDGCNGTLAMLCKTNVARKVLLYGWKNGIDIICAEIYFIDAKKHFGANVDACLLVCDTAPIPSSYRCSVFKDLHDNEPLYTIGYMDNQLVANLALYDQWKHLQGEELFKWRSGVKHDCSKVMELVKQGSTYRNGMGEIVELEDDYIYPLLKSSDLAKGDKIHPNRWVIITQRNVGDDTKEIMVKAPKTWDYLSKYARYLDRRASSIYRNRPRFSIFGIGDYSFAPWKVGISGFYKKLVFTLIGNINGKPIILDDTGYFLSFNTESEAKYIHSLLDSNIAKRFFEAFIFWDMKRPITIDLLRRLNLLALAKELGSELELEEYLAEQRYQAFKQPESKNRLNFDNGFQGKLFD